ncbi:hypothetical protein H2198_006002 [Neophaeococcomyces mojaviensis]|uniref:Uncharacterized protein n=1 Tax=Neophaeococcomyces mojaviensis TaxID=3383035 RepID=A0ACC3A447_9EURO|nr:hypothetical protein H2198_006002 [Knufia sp. JES_112]
MPPFVGRKRLSQSPPPSREPPAKRAKVDKIVTTKKPAPAPKKTKALRFGEDDSSSSLSDVDSDEFEDVSTSRPQKTIAASDNEDEVEWEDAPAQTSAAPDFSNRQFKDVKITVSKDEEPDFSTARAGAKKGPSRREKAVRMHTHKMHVQMLLWHNSIRNAWINDKKVQEILLNQLPSQISREIERWKRASGLIEPEVSPKESKQDKKKKRKNKLSDVRSQRDWGQPSQRLEEGKPDMSRGDPLISLLKVLAAYWKKMFAVTAPGLRKRGYGTKLGLRQDIESFRNNKHNPARHGERIESLMEFRKMAEKCEGSRDAGAQLFTALLRAIGIEGRLVASLQPAGYGFTKAEQMVPRKVVEPVQASDSSGESEEESKQIPKSKSKMPSKKSRVPPNGSVGGEAAPIDLDTEAEEEEDSSVVDVTPFILKARPPKYDRDLVFPVYWTEAVSPITSRVVPVCPLVLENAVATSAEALSLFEPRGAKAEKARQVMAYVVAYSSDRTAKDVTVRYLRKRLWPGKSKGFRVPVEKIPIYDKRGKIRGHEDYDWFKHVLSIYTRSDAQRTAVDDVEDVIDLVPAELEKKDAEIDTLQSLKSSAEFVLERHLRREEALKPSAQPVRMFTSGKGDKQITESVYKRSDVLRVATAESWHKEGRAPKEGEVPIKLAPVRAVTLARKREAEEHQIRTGEKQMQGLYSQEQTDWIIPPPIEDGKIPKNGYGNIDCFVPSMVPRGAVHVPLKGTVRICKKLEIDYAEAVVGFEFGNKMAVPVIQGVVIAKEHDEVVRDAWREWNEEQKRKEESKMEKLVLDLWRKFVLGLRIRARVHDEYTVDLGDTHLERGATRGEPMVIDDEEKLPDRTSLMLTHDEHEFGGGFLPESDDEAAKHEDLVIHVASQEDTKHLVRDYDDGVADADAMAVQYPTPVHSAATGNSRCRKTRINGTDESELSEPDEQEAGGFLSKDDAKEIRLVAAPYGKTTASAPMLSSGASSSGSEENFTPQAQSQRRSHGRSQKFAGVENTSSTKVQTTTLGVSTMSRKTRATPLRNAKGKAQVKIAMLGGTGDTTSPSETSNDEEDDGDESPPRASKLSSTTSVKRGRGRPRKGRTGKVTADGDTRAKKTEKPGRKIDKKSLLRKESTLITSPYFGDD